MIKKFLKYYKLVFWVSVLTLKYRFLLSMLSDQALINFITFHLPALREKEKRRDNKLSKNILIKRTSIILKRFFPNVKCLINSLVLCEILIRSGYRDEQIMFGLNLDEEKVMAHAWINENRDNNYVIIYRL